MNYATESDEDLVFRLKGALRAVIDALENADAEALDRIRRDEWRLEISREGVRALQRTVDDITGAGEEIADEFKNWSE